MTCGYRTTGGNKTCKTCRLVSMRHVAVDLSLCRRRTCLLPISKTLLRVPTSSVIRSTADDRFQLYLLVTSQSSSTQPRARLLVQRLNHVTLLLQPLLSSSAKSKKMNYIIDDVRFPSRCRVPEVSPVLSGSCCRVQQMRMLDGRATTAQAKVTAA